MTDPLRTREPRRDGVRAAHGCILTVSGLCCIVRVEFVCMHMCICYCCLVCARLGMHVRAIFVMIPLAL